MDGFKRFLVKVFDSLEIPFFIVSYPDLRFVVSNRANNGSFFSMLPGRGIPPEEVTGKAFDEVFSPSEATSALRDVLDRAGREKRVVRLDDLPVPCARDVAKIFNIVCFPFTDDGREAKEYVAGSARDMTYPHKIAELEKLISWFKETLEKKESLLSILNILPLGVVLSSNDGVVRYVNESLYWLTGYEKQELLGLSRDGAEKVLFGCDHAVESEDNTCLITKFNESKPVEIYRVPLVRMGLVYGTVTLIREKTAEHELQAIKRTLKAVLDSVLSTVIIADRDQNILACSKAGLEIFELNEEEVTGRSLLHLFDLLKVQSRELSYQTVNGKQYVDKIQATITTRSQKCKTVLFSNTPIFGRGGEFIGMVSVGSEITTFIEKQEKIIENERMAVIGQLTTSIAHEIKNPLTVISGFAEVTKSKIQKISGNESLKESMLYYQQEIIDNSRNMNRLIVDLLQLARPKRSEKVKINLSGTLDKICNTITPYALQRNVTLVKNLAPSNLEMAVDPVQIGQVLLNLCNNAIQAMEDGGTLSVTTECSDGHFIIQVSDTGYGIKPEDLGKLGTPFFTTKAEGTGLGLSVSYSIIRDYGGKIEVDSEVGRGSTFKVFLPLEKN